MGTPSLIWVLLFVRLTRGQETADVLGYGRSPSVSKPCPSGCATCSPGNGCLTCKPRLFFHLEQDRMRQRGTCLASCPRSHFGVRSRHINTCTRCKEDCASCFSEQFCTHCHVGRFLYRGKCESSCPNGLTANPALRECTECSADCEVCVRWNVCVKCRADLFLLHGQCHHTCPRGFEPDLQHKQCLPQVHCQVGSGQTGAPVFREEA